MRCRWRLAALLSVLALCLVVPGNSADTKKSKKTIPPVKFDSSAEKVDVFEGMEQGLVDVKIVMKDSLGGNMFIENKSDKPLNIEFPAVFVGRQVLKQGFGGLGGGGLGGGLGGGGLGGGLGGGGLGGGGLGGGGQSAGGGFGGGGLGGGGLGGGGLGGGGLGGGGLGGGGGIFSVPPDRIVRVPFRSVCLEHGKAEPIPSMTYVLTKLEDFNDDPVLEEVLKLVATGKLDAQAGQAAAWHITDKMSWEELDAKFIPHIGRPATKYFSLEQMRQAMQIFQVAVTRVADRRDADKTSVAANKTSSRSSSTTKRDSR